MAKRWAWAALLVLLVSACQADVVVDIDVVEDGSGRVTLEVLLDRDAVGQLGLVEAQVRAGGLAAAGWSLNYDDTSDGSARLVATKQVITPDQWQSVLDEIAGPGVFRDVRVRSVAEGARRSRVLEMDVDLSRGWSLFADDEAIAALGGEPLGVPIESLTDGRAIDEIVAVQIETSVMVDRDVPAASSSFVLRFDDTEPQPVKLAAAVENSAAVLLRWIAIALALLCALALLLAATGIVMQRRAERQRRRSPSASLASRVPSGESGAVPPAVASSEVPGVQAGEPVRLVVVEPRSVLYQRRSEIDEVLLPFVRRMGGQARADTIIDGHKSVLAGSMDTDAFWPLCGVDGEGLDEGYVALRELRAGARDFLAEMQRRRAPIAAVTNDAAVWSDLARERDRLHAVWPWVVSAEAGAPKPDFGVFEALHRRSGVAYRHCLYVDTDLASLDAARDLGMRTALFDADGLGIGEGSDHPVVTNFKQLFQ